MDDFQKQLQRLKHNPVLAQAFDKRRTEAEVAFQIRRIREAKGWPQKDLAKKVGCSQQAVSSVEQAGYKVTRCRYFAASPPYWMLTLSSL
jgi:ribosome-binding protein aMBF1 (putative translation factor)